MDERWAEVDTYFAERLAPSDPVLGAVLAANAEAGLPPHDVSPLQGRFLELMVRLTGASRILEIGTLGAYSTLWMARALPPGGRIVTLETDPRHAGVARANLALAGVADRVDLRAGPALETLPGLDDLAPFDLVFIDADKPSNPDYLAWALRLTRPGSLIVADNVVRGGAVADAASGDPRVHGIRRFTDLIAAEPRLIATAVQTVGSKGWDGFAIALVVDPHREPFPLAEKPGSALSQRRVGDDRGLD
ncbi:MAG TPA: O-methyltransferase [Allosphingosinicella sp.]|jgi:predicted O-methyltransferase YrrM